VEKEMSRDYGALRLRVSTSCAAVVVIALCVMVIYGLAKHSDYSESA
jgi:hypothetical protein